MKVRWGLCGEVLLPPWGGFTGKGAEEKSEADILREVVAGLCIRLRKSLKVEDILDRNEGESSLG